MEKPGWKTTEFWMALATALISVLVVLGLVSPTDSDAASGAISNAITSIFALVANATVIYKYIHSRTELKSLDRSSNNHNSKMGFR